MTDQTASAGAAALPKAPIPTSHDRTFISYGEFPHIVAHARR
jgi:hypothetical protein